MNVYESVTLPMNWPQEVFSGILYEKGNDQHNVIMCNNIIESLMRVKIIAHIIVWTFTRKWESSDDIVLITVLPVLIAVCLHMSSLASFFADMCIN